MTRKELEFAMRNSEEVRTKLFELELDLNNEKEAWGAYCSYDFFKEDLNEIDEDSYIYNFINDEELKKAKDDDDFADELYDKYSDEIKQCYVDFLLDECEYEAIYEIVEKHTYKNGRINLTKIVDEIYDMLKAEREDYDLEDIIRDYVEEHKDIYIMEKVTNFKEAV